MPHGLIMENDYLSISITFLLWQHFEELAERSKAHTNDVSWSIGRWCLTIHIIVTNLFLCDGAV